MWQNILINADVIQTLPTIYAVGSNVYITLAMSSYHRVISLSTSSGGYNWQAKFNSTFGLYLYASATSPLLVMDDA